MLEDTYVNIGITLTRYVEGTDFYKVKKRLWYANSITVGRYHEKNMLDTKVYEV